MPPYLFWMGSWLRDLLKVQHHISLITRDKRRSFLRKKVTIYCIYLILVNYLISISSLSIQLIYLLKIIVS